MSSHHVVALPRWFLVLRIFQILIAVAVLGMCAYGIYWIPYNSWCLALFTSIATFIVVLYSVLTYHVEACHAAYNYWAVLALDIFAIVFWLSSMAYVAATRSAYIFPVVYPDIICPDYYDSYDCAIKKRDIDLMKRDIATYPYLNMMSASAGLAGLEMILFIVTLAIFGVLVHRHRSSGAPNTSSPGKLEAHPMGTTPTAQVQQAQPQPQPEYAPPGQ